MIRYNSTILHEWVIDLIWKIIVIRMKFQRNFQFPSCLPHWYKWIYSSTAHMRNSSQFLVITVDRIIRPSYLACCVLQPFVDPFHAFRITTGWLVRKAKSLHSRSPSGSCENGRLSTVMSLKYVSWGTF